ncbi:MAG: WYL domain-containing protein [Dysgonamonadaceae bacterium]|jgi:predicted DNA-binding transcriptional regulator YafY|nr:WYL domain-containing protein [Dysgonamonadaceae bacterium]
MDQPKIERLLRLMKLLTGNISYTIEDLGERLDMSVRTVYRYIDTFREAGFIIKKNGDYIRLDKSSPYFKDISQLIHFTEEEAYILKSAIESIDENNLLKQNLKRKLTTVYNYKILAETVVRTQNARNVNKILEAIENRQIIVLKNYRSSNSQNVRDRCVEPFSFTTNYIQLWAFDVESGTNKLFNINRIENVEILPEKWKYADRHQAGFIDIFRISTFEQLPVKLRLGMLSASLLTEEYPLAEKYLTKVSDNEFILETNVCSYEGVGRFVLGLLSDIEIIESEDFKEFVRRKLEKFEGKVL